MAALINSKGGEKSLGTFGEYVIGRGPLLEITDKRVSRNHAVVKVEENGSLMSICSKHSNPCFHKPASDDKFVQLQKDVWQKLEHNDQISLLHYSIEELVFTVKLMEKETLKDSSQNTPTDSKSNQQPSSNVSSELNKPLEQDSISNTSNEQMLKTDSSTLTVPETSSVTTSSTASSSMRKTRKLPSWLLEIKPSDSKPSLQKSASRSSSSSKVKPSSTAADTKKPKSKQNSSSKRKRKVEDSEEEKEEEDSEDKPSSSSIAVEEKNTVDDAIVAKLPLCPYGKSCYRKNPLHFKEYSHDDEKDESDNDNRPECPYGTSCYRQNELHKQQYKHTTAPSTAVSTKRTRRSTRGTKPSDKKAKKSVLAEESDDDGESNTYDYNDSFIDDNIESSSSSYGPESEEDEDWAPPIDDEDVNELVSDANDFMTNKKMQK